MCSIARVCMLLFPQKIAYPLCKWIMRSIWAPLMILATFTRVKKIDFHKAHKVKQPCLVISNHTTWIDIPSMLAYLPVWFLFLSKASVFKYPFIGPIMQLMNFIPIERASILNAGHAVLNIVRQMQEGNNVLIYPEGTTNSRNDGSLLKFRPGIVLIAEKMNCDILPVLVYHDIGMNEPAQFSARPETMLIKILDPIVPGDKLYPDATASKKSLEKIHTYLSQEYQNLRNS